jgi:hypothetical protein
VRVNYLTVSLLFFMLPVTMTEAILLNGTAAQVGKELITVQDIYFYRALIKYKDGETVPVKPEEGSALRKTIQKVVFEEMVYSEMKSFHLEEGSRVDAERVLQIQRAKGREGMFKEILRQFGRTETQAVDRLLKSLQVEKFVKRKVETLTPVITEGEAERYYRQNLTRFQGSSFESLKSNIILLLREQRMKTGLEEWIHFLEDKYGVSILVDAG